jgi:hypothetical protein
MAELTASMIREQERRYQQSQALALRDRNIAESNRNDAERFKAQAAEAEERRKRANDAPYGRYMAEKDQEDRVKKQERAKQDANLATWRNGGYPPGYHRLPDDCQGFICGDPVREAAIAAEKKAFDLLKANAEISSSNARDSSYQKEMPGLIAAYGAALIRSNGDRKQLDQVGTNAINRINQLSYGYGGDKTKFLAPVRLEEERVKNAIKAQKQSEKVNTYNTAQAAINNQIAAFGLKPNTTAAIVKADVTATMTKDPSNSANYVPNWKRKQDEAYAAELAAGNLLSNIAAQQQAASAGSKKAVATPVPRAAAKKKKPSKPKGRKK